jgi:hypothetical protein
MGAGSIGNVPAQVVELLGRMGAGSTGNVPAQLVDLLGRSA